MVYQATREGLIRPGKANTRVRRGWQESWELHQLDTRPCGLRADARTYFVVWRGYHL